MAAWGLGRRMAAAAGKHFRRFAFRKKRNEPFRILQSNIDKTDCNHHYINYLPFTTPSLEYRELDDLLYRFKVFRTKINQSKWKPSPTMQVKLLRIWADPTYNLLPPSPSENTVVDEIYLNDDIRFAFISHHTASAENGVILFLHGGAYIGDSYLYSLPLLSVLSELTKCVAITVDYKCAPEYPLSSSPNCIEDALSVYQWLSGKKQMNISSHCPPQLQQFVANDAPKKIVVAGDSAGGGLSLSLLQNIKQKELAQPNCAWMISPWANLGKPSKKKLQNQPNDAFIDEQDLVEFVPFVAGNIDMESGLVKVEGDDGYVDPSDVRCSPVNGDFAGLCPLYVSVGGGELFLEDALNVAANAHNAGVKVQMEIEPYLCHIYPVFIGLCAEARQAAVRASEFIKGHL